MSVVHFEIPADNVKRAQEFYNKAFGWQISQYPGMDYYMVGTTASDKNGMPTSPGAINGGMTKRGGPVMAPVVTISVKDIDEALKKVSSMGGKVVAPKTAVGDMGFTAYFKDTEGNVMGLYQDAHA
jgi:predicted enzyme related to lactoylglutathione lyase